MPGNPNVRSEHARTFTKRRRELETEIKNATINKHQIDAQISALEKQRDQIVNRVLALRSQLEVVNRELENAT
jgi:chromosome segregation ATPase